MSAFHADLILTLHLIMFKRGQIAAQCRVTPTTSQSGQKVSALNTLTHYHSSSNPGRSGGRIFFYKSQLCELTLIRCPFHPHVTAVACKRPWSFCQKCRWQVTHKHAYTLDPTKSEWADYAVIQAWCGNISRNKLTRNLSGNIRPQSSQLTEPVWTDRGLNSGISACKLIST